MEHFFISMLHGALWAFLIILALAVVGVIAIVSWVMAALRKTESAVQTGVSDVESKFRR